MRKLPHSVGKFISFVASEYENTLHWCLFHFRFSFSPEHEKEKFQLNN